jgi:hypothetical protein
MAEFSKQWAEINDPEGGWDFDVEEISNQLEPNHYVPMICEGFGFIAIGKDAENKIMLAIPTGEVEEEDGQTYDAIKWEAYEDIIK